MIYDILYRIDYWNAIGINCAEYNRYKIKEWYSFLIIYYSFFFDAKLNAKSNRLSSSLWANQNHSW